MANLLWQLHIEDRPMGPHEIPYVPCNRNERMASCRELLNRKHIRYSGEKYEITEVGESWLNANRHLVADLILEQARGRVANSVFNLAQTYRNDRRKS